MAALVPRFRPQNVPDRSSPEISKVSCACTSCHDQPVSWSLTPPFSFSLSLPSPWCPALGQCLLSALYLLYCWLWVWSRIDNLRTARFLSQYLSLTLCLLAYTRHQEQLPDTEDKAGKHHESLEPKSLPGPAHTGADPVLSGAPGCFPLWTDSAQVPAL